MKTAKEIPKILKRANSPWGKFLYWFKNFMGLNHPDWMEYEKEKDKTCSSKCPYWGFRGIGYKEKDERKKKFLHAPKGFIGKPVCLKKMRRITRVTGGMATTRPMRDCGGIVDIDDNPLKKDRTFCIIKPNVEGENIDKLKNDLKDFGFDIIHERRRRISYEQATKLYKEHHGKEFYGRLINFITSGDSSILILERENAQEELRNRIPYLRTKYGHDTTKNAIHGSDSKDAVSREMVIFLNL